MKHIPCACVGITGYGTFENEVLVPFPERFGGTMSHVCIDWCIVAEVMSLWELGIITTWSCCGHNIKGDGGGVIGVKDEFIPAMKALGYKVFPNNCRPGDEDSFYCKTTNDYSSEASNDH